MRAEDKRLVRWQLEETIKPYRSIQWSQIPQKGWIRAIRDALGMSGRQLAEKLGVKPPRVSVLEKDEVLGRVTLKTMKRTAETLNCVFIYALIPRASLEELVRNQAIAVVQERMKRVGHSMALEDQKLDEELEKKSFQDIVDEMMREMPRSLWDKRQ